MVLFQSLFVVGAVLIAYVRAAPEGSEEQIEYYTELGFDPDAQIPPTDSEIKKAFRALSRQYHPDHAGPEGEKRYLRVQAAYRVLGDAPLRKVYDMMGHEGLKKYEDEKNSPEHAQGGMHPFFGRQSNRGPTAKLKLTVPLEKVYNGDFTKLNIAKNKICSKCKGSGAFSKDHMKPCKACNGEGSVMENIQFGPFVQTVRQPCKACSGKGKIPAKPCAICKGRKVVKREVPLEISIERGLPEGHEVTYELEGEENPDQLPGDLILEVRTEAHPVFRRDGNDLHTSVTLSLVEALVGFRKTLTHLDGRHIVLHHRGVTSPGVVRQVVGEGMPIHHVPADRGVLHVTYNVDIPTSLSQKQKTILRDVFPQKSPPGAKLTPTTV